MDLYRYMLNLPGALPPVPAVSGRSVHLTPRWGGIGVYFPARVLFLKGLREEGLWQSMIAEWEHT